jgi:hypothetical protein
MNRKRTALSAAALGTALGVAYAIRALASGIPSTNALSCAGFHAYSEVGLRK